MGWVLPGILGGDDLFRITGWAVMVDEGLLLNSMKNPRMHAGVLLAQILPIL